VRDLNNTWERKFPARSVCGRLKVLRGGRGGLERAEKNEERYARGMASGKKLGAIEEGKDRLRWSLSERGRPEHWGLTKERLNRTGLKGWELLGESREGGGA